MASIIQSNYNFTTDFYSALSHTQIQHGNLLFSPASVQLVLALLFVGARSSSAEQLERVLHLDDHRKRYLNSASRQVLSSTGGEHADNQPTSLGHSGNTQSRPRTGLNDGQIEPLVNITNAYSTEGRLIVEPGFAEIALLLNFEREVTNGLTNRRGNAPRGSWPVEEFLFLSSKSTFYNRWNQIFNRSETVIRPFHPKDGESIDIPFLHSTGSFFYAESGLLSSSVIRIPFQGDRLSLLIILPNSFNLPAVEQLVSEYGFESIVSSVRYYQSVCVYIPKFSLSFNTELTPALQNLNVTHIFTDEADFSGINGVATLRVQNIQSNANFVVDEETPNVDSSHAAVVVPKLYNNNSRRRRDADTVFTADRPFLFYILDVVEKTVYFVGRYTGPPPCNS